MAAGSFWHFIDTVDPTSENFNNAVFAQNEVSQLNR